MGFRFSGKNKSIVTGLLCSVALLLVVSACGSGSGGSATQAQTSASTRPIQEIRVNMGDFFYEPSDITVKSGKVRLILSNVGATAHRFSIKDGDTVKWTSKNVGAGRESVLEVDLVPGSYRLGCTLGDHEARGAAGKLTVQ